ncbi:MULTISPECIES: hypothetical protein [Streptomyces diastaticus group]|uniref:hypothetical protein n=1 Tax=Streptomyces diastaticus group TaxID=2849069 RepID=UPI003431DDBA
MGHPGGPGAAGGRGRLPAGGRVPGRTGAGARGRAVGGALPAGRWYDTATGRAYQGGAAVPVEVAADRLPVFARAGAVVPVRGADGEVEWEVWAPAPGRGGAGMVVRESGVLERMVSRWEEGRVVVREEGRGEEVRGTARVRGVG